MNGPNALVDHMLWHLLREISEDLLAVATFVAETPVPVGLPAKKNPRPAVIALGHVSLSPFGGATAGIIFVPRLLHRQLGAEG